MTGVGDAAMLIVGLARFPHYWCLHRGLLFVVRLGCSGDWSVDRSGDLVMSVMSLVRVYMVGVVRMVGVLN